MNNEDRGRDQNDIPDPTYLLSKHFFAVSDTAQAQFSAHRVYQIHIKHPKLVKIPI